MLLLNPFTRQVLNANPRGDNQYVNPDGPSQGIRRFNKIRHMESSKRPKSVSDEFGRNLHSVAGFVMPDGTILDVDDEHAEAVFSHPTEFGLTQEDLPKIRGMFEAPDDPVTKAVAKGAIRFRGNAVELNSKIHTPGKLGILIARDKIPISSDGTVYIDSEDFGGSSTMDELLMAKSWRHLDYQKKRLRG